MLRQYNMQKKTATWNFCVFASLKTTIVKFWQTVIFYVVIYNLLKLGKHVLHLLLIFLIIFYFSKLCTHNLICICISFNRLSFEMSISQLYINIFNSNKIILHSEFINNNRVKFSQNPSANYGAGLKGIINPLTPELFYQKHKKNDEMDGISKS